MITLFRANDGILLKDLKAAMREHIRKLPQQVSFIGEPKKILRFELPCEKSDILSWLHNNQLEDDMVYFSDRDGSFETGGIGSADKISAEDAIDLKELFEHMQERLSANNPELRYYGGFNFDLANCAKEWQSLGSYCFAVPQFEFFHLGNNYFFAFNIAIADIHEEKIHKILADLERLDFQQGTHYRQVPKALARLDTPNEAQWKNNFDSLFVNGKLMLDKVVLARRTDFSFDVDIRPMALMKHLKEMSPHCFHFCFQPNSHFGFLGASPERLYKRMGEQLVSEALAGTTQRGTTAEKDNHLARELLHCVKNNKEHQFVVQELREELERLCTSLTQDNRARLIKFDSGQHLKTSFEGTLRRGIEDHQILQELHPTPAVGGCPKEKALDLIKKFEPFNRGWYAAPVGYVGFDESEFAVAIRSGLVQGNKLSLFAGAGIVEGSTAEDEWEEIENKIGSFIKVFHR